MTGKVHGASELPIDHDVPDVPREPLSVHGTAATAGTVVLEANRAAEDVVRQ